MAISRSPILPFALLLCLAWGAVDASAAELRGHLELLGRNGKPLRASEMASAVVYYEPAKPQRLRPPAEPVEMVTRNKQFRPRVLPVVRGTEVRFPNADPILHNVFSNSPGNVFDMGLFRRGPGKARVFDRSGLVRVFCNVHYSMIGYLLVLDTPYFTVPEADGSFRLSDLPAGAGKLSVWYERGKPTSLDVRVPSSAPVELRVELQRRRVPPHLNKFGKPYSRGGRDDDY